MGVVWKFDLIRWGSSSGREGRNSPLAFKKQKTQLLVVPRGYFDDKIKLHWSIIT